MKNEKTSGAIARGFQLGNAYGAQAKPRHGAFWRWSMVKAHRMRAPEESCLFWNNGATPFTPKTPQQT